MTSHSPCTATLTIHMTRNDIIFRSHSQLGSHRQTSCNLPGSTQRHHHESWHHHPSSPESVKSGIDGTSWEGWMIMTLHYLRPCHRLLLPISAIWTTPISPDSKLVVLYLYDAIYGIKYGSVRELCILSASSSSVPFSTFIFYLILAMILGLADKERVFHISHSPRRRLRMKYCTLWYHGPSRDRKAR